MSGPTPGAAGARESTSLDLGVLKDLIGDDPESICQLLRLYLTSATASSSALGAALAIHDRALLQSTAHSLKSSSVSVGARELGQICADLEAGSETGEWHELQAQIVAARSTFARVADAARTCLARMACGES